MSGKSTYKECNNKEGSVAEKNKQQKRYTNSKNTITNSKNISHNKRTHHNALNNHYHSRLSLLLIKIFSLCSNWERETLCLISRGSLLKHRIWK